MVPLRELLNPANYVFNVHGIPPFIISIYCFFLGIWPLCKRGKKGLSLFVFDSATGIWLFSFSLMYLSGSVAVAYTWNKIAYFFNGVCFISVNSYLFSLDVAGNLIEQKKEKIILYSGYIVMSIFAFLTFYTDLVVAFPPRTFFWGYYTNPGVLHHFFLAVWLFFVLKGTVVLYRAFVREQNTLEKDRIRVFLYAYLLGYLGAIDFLPVFGFGIYPFGYIFIGVYLTLFVYNFIKYKAMGIETVIHKTLLWLASILLLIIPAGVSTFLVARSLMGNSPPFLLVIILSVLFLFFNFYYEKVRPKIDYFFGKKQYDYYELLGRVSTKVSTVLDIKELSTELLRELEECIITEKILLWIIDEEKKYFVLSAVKIGKKLPSSLPGEKQIITEDDLLLQYLKKTQKVMEPPLIAINPEFHSLKGSSYYQYLVEEKIEVLVPLSREEKTVGLLCLGRKRSLKTYTKKDIEILQALGTEVGISIFNALHYRDLIEKERLDEEVKLGREIQDNLLPKTAPDIEGLKIAGLMIPAKEIGGDYYDYIVTNKSADSISRMAYGKDEKDNGNNVSAISDKPYAISGPDSISHKPLAISKVSIVIGDVSGKGVGAGLIMATAKATLKGLSQQGLSPRGTLGSANRILHEYTQGEKFMTMLYLEWDALNKKMRYSSGGHEHIIIYRSKAGSQIVDSSSEIVDSKLELVEKTKNEQVPATNYQLQTTNSPCVEVIPSGGFVLGMLPEIEEYLEDKELMLNPGDKIVLYTDGITEAHNESNDMYSLARLAETVRQHGHKPCEELLFSIKADVYGFIGQAEQYDDITMVIIEKV